MDARRELPRGRDPQALPARTPLGAQPDLHAALSPQGPVVEGAAARRLSLGSPRATEGHAEAAAKAAGRPGVPSAPGTPLLAAAGAASPAAASPVLAATAEAAERGAAVEGAGAAAPGAGALPSGEPRVRRSVAYRCPACNEIVPSMEEALRHCASSSSRGAAASSPRGPVGAKSAPSGATGGPDQLAAAGAPCEEAGPKPEPVAFDEHGRPTIVRWVDPETGAARTVVRSEDGSQRSFGESTMASLLSAKKEEAAKWASALAKDLTNLQLRGLVHELGQRLLQISQRYTTRLDELKKLSEELDYQYFGLDNSATEKDLDNAYRRFAKKMHPDKNGGTEEAKVRFQKMKERYEGLKTKMGGVPEEGQPQEPAEGPANRRNVEGGEPEHAEQGGCYDKPSETHDEEDADKAGKEVGADKENTDKDEERSREKASAGKGYDPSDKDSMVKTVSRYAKQLRDMNGKMEVLMRELEKAQAYNQAGN